METPEENFEFIKNQPFENQTSENNKNFPLKKIINTKLFQKFLNEEKSKKSNCPAKKNIVNKPFPLKISSNSTEKHEQSIQTPEISVDSSRFYSEQSEIQGFSQHIFATSPDKQHMQYPFYPLYMPYGETLKDSESFKQESENMKKEFLLILNEKEAEISKLRKELESSKLDVMELEDKIREMNAEDTEELEKKINNLLDQNQKLQESNRSLALESKNKVFELESSLKLGKQRYEDLMHEFYKEKDRSEMLESRLSAVKERAGTLENSSFQASEKILYLERELENTYRELDSFKNRFAERNDFYDTVPNTARNYHEEYRPKFDEFNYSRPRNTSIQNDPWQRTEKSPIQRQSLEQKLDLLVSDKQRLEKEYYKLPEVCKNVSSKRRKEELELELEILDTNIHNLRSKIKNRLKQH